MKEATGVAFITLIIGRSSVYAMRLAFVSTANATPKSTPSA